ncbi:MAG TPA: TRAP transporter small permease [Hyphomicrobiaceae bacterium]
MGPEAEVEKSDEERLAEEGGVLRNLEINIAALALVAFIVLASAQVISRYGLNRPIPWIEEVSAILLIWMTFIGAAWLVRKDRHIRVELLEEWVHPRVCAVIYTVYDIISIAFLILLAIGGFQLVGAMDFERTPALQIPYRYIVSVVPATALLMAAYFVVIIYRRIAGQKKN